MSSAILVQHSNQPSYEATAGRVGHFSGSINTMRCTTIIETEFARQCKSIVMKNNGVLKFYIQQHALYPIKDLLT